MTTIGEARDQLIDSFRTAWLANPTSAAVPLEYDDVVADTDAEPDASTRRQPFGRVTVQVFAGEQETQGRIDQRRFLNTCGFALQLFTEIGDGNKKADALVAIALRILRRLRDPNGVWGTGDASSTKIGVVRGMAQTNVTATFNYEERA